jgi:UDP-N-acetylglucosamine diphosphorylase/glucosamine-1-phosphate N-acetyltransferase
MARPDTVVLFDDAVARDWHPFSLTRPAGELVFGAGTFRARAERIFGAPLAGHIAPHLAGWDEPGSAAVIEPAGVDRATARLYICSRLVPAPGTTIGRPSEDTLIVLNGDVVGWFAPPGSAGPHDDFFDVPGAGGRDLPRLSIGGRLLESITDLVANNEAQLNDDLAPGPLASPSPVPSHVTSLNAGPDQLRVSGHVTFEPGVVIDCTHGPVCFEDGVTVRAFTRIAGPAWIGPGTTLLGGSYAAVSIGPACRVRGEIEASIFLGYSNKAHDGFIGHAVIGRWVNLGALTTNSDLKNNYGTVRIATPDGERDTGQRKVGCFLGDHVKTAIGTLLNTGTVVGPGANVFGARMPPKYVAPFAWGTDGDVQDFDRFLRTAGIVMERRNVALTRGVERVLRHAWEHAVSGGAAR